MPLPFMTSPEASLPAIITIDDFGLDRGAHLLIDAALLPLGVGARLAVCGSAPELSLHLTAWCRAAGHGFIAATPHRRQVRPATNAHQPPRHVRSSPLPEHLAPPR
jgi:hypothetical protein